MMELRERFGKIVSVLFLLFWVFVLPDLLYYVWSSLVNMINKIPFISDRYFAVFSGLVMGSNVLTLILCNVGMYFVYMGKFKSLEKYRISQAPWPWEVDAQEWRGMVKRSILLTFFNATFLSFGILYLQSLIVQIPKCFSFSMEEWPSKLDIVLQFMFYLLICEITVYWPHWLLHSNPTLYKIHKEHHLYYRSISIATIDAHPIEFILSNLLTTALGFMVLSLIKKVHLITICLWVSFRLLQAIQVHTGYEFPWGILKFIPSKAGTDFHDFHHSHNSGCFGGFLKLTDSLMKTDQQYWKFKAKINKTF